MGSQTKSHPDSRAGFNSAGDKCAVASANVAAGQSTKWVNFSEQGWVNSRERQGGSDLSYCFVGSPSRARTYDLRINSPSLYQLSYRGT
jgi:hypothetical protein